MDAPLSQRWDEFMNRAAFSLMFLALMSATPSAGEAPPFRAQGNEPSWSLQVTDKALTFQPMDGNAISLKPVPSPRIDGEARMYEVKAGKETFTLRIGNRICTDTMSGMPFPNTVGVAIGTRQFSGCGGDPSKLLQGTWLITTVNGKPVVHGSSPSIAFGADGKLSGNGGCNQFFGGYQLSGEGLTVGSVGASKMMCEDALMAQETMVLDVLKDLVGFAVPGKRQLLLRTQDGRTISSQEAG